MSNALRGSTDQAGTLRELAGRAKGRAATTPSRIKVREGLRVISVTSGKGGVGKSSVVVNLAASLAAMGKRVLIVDADLGLGDVTLRLGVTARFGLQHVLSGDMTMEDILVDAGGGISILPGVIDVQQYTALTPSERQSLLQGMLALQDRFDYFLIDTGAGISANVIGFAAAAREVMLVVTPEPTSITDAYALIKTLSGRDETFRFRLLVNMARSQEEGSLLYSKLTAITGRFLNVAMDYTGCILKDDMLVESVRRRGALCRLYPDAKASLGFRVMAQKLAAEGGGSASSLPMEPMAASKQWRSHELSS